MGRPKGKKNIFKDGIEKGVLPNTLKGKPNENDMTDAFVSKGEIPLAEVIKQLNIENRDLREQLQILKARYNDLEFRYKKSRKEV